MADKYKIKNEAPLLYRLAHDLTRAEAFEAPFLMHSLVARLASFNMSFAETLVRSVYSSARIKITADEVSLCWEGGNTNSANWKEKIGFVLDHGLEYLTEVERTDVELFSIRRALDVYELAKVEMLVDRISQAWGEDENRADEEREAAAVAEREQTARLTASGKRRGRRPKQMKLAI